MSGSVDLRAYLATLEGDGEFQGTGQFTIDRQRSADKIAGFSLPRSSAWVCKFVQAAVGWSVDALLVNQGRVYTTFSYDWGDRPTFLTEDELLRTFTGPLTEDGPVGSLCMGLRALVVSAELSFLLVLHDGSDEPKRLYAGDFFSKMSDHERLSLASRKSPGLTILVVNQHHAGPFQGVRFRARQQASVAFELDSYCYLSPVPIKIDGRRVDGLLRAPEFLAGKRFAPLYTGGLPVVSGVPDMPVPHDFEERRMSIHTSPSRARRPYSGIRSFGACIFLGLNRPPGEPKTRSWIHWVRHGVIIESVPIAVPTVALVCRLYLNADQARTDLTGFQVSREDAASILRPGLRRLSEMLGTLPLEQFAFSDDRDLRSILEEEQETSKRRSRRSKGVIAGAIAGLALAPFWLQLGTTLAMGSCIAGLILPDELRILFQAHGDPLEETQALRADLARLQGGLAELSRKRG